MFTSFVTALALAASVSRVAASPIVHVARGYAQDTEILEDYTPYHVRYLALSCQDKHNTEFFEQCCHPLLRWQKLSDRPAQCIPSPSASSSAVLAEPTASTIDEEPIYTDDGDCETASPSTPVATIATEPTTSYQSSPTPTPTSTRKAKSYAPPTSSVEPTPSDEPTTTAKPTTAKPTPTAAPNTGDGEVFTGGFATFYEQRGVAGACGDVHGEYDMIVAADFRRYGPLDKKSDLCGKKVLITNTDNGKQVTATIADACPSCVSPNSLDLSYGAFDKLGARETGMLPISWKFV
jgi:rare lipoprotein A (peptidoglycan hydrolase)